MNDKRQIMNDTLQTTNYKLQTTNKERESAGARMDEYAPSTCSVRGNGGGSAVGGVYARRTRGLYMPCASPPPPPVRALLSSSASEATSPVWKKPGRVCWRM